MSEVETDDGFSVIELMVDKENKTISLRDTFDNQELLMTFYCWEELKLAVESQKE